MTKKSHLYQYHKDNGKMTEFSGFEMPVWYKGIVEEHLAVRNAAGLFDVSHMGRVWITGPDATKFLGYLLPTNPTMVKDGRAFYSTICNPNGGIIDDVITNKFSEERYFMVVNAGNRGKDFSWLRSNSSEFQVALDDFSNQSALMAIQGPLARDILQKMVDIDLSTVRRFAFRECLVSNEKCLVSRTGYTGEDGFEITVFDTPVEDPERALKIWNEILRIGGDLGVLPCGLGARDSLRLEAGMCLYGQDIDDTTTPIEAALDGVLSRDERNFVGKEKINQQLIQGTERKRVAFSMIESGIPRHGYDLSFSGQRVGNVTSGTFSPILKKGIGMGYLKSPLSNIGQQIGIQIRESTKMSEVVYTPFYDTTRFGYKRKPH
ncbi:MAG TPA: glycine cleavage system aminomethyltransferase GcvT [Nitrososphaerales archaeon]|nr:glycine cleavage system aminomethyltransferase GcvT [Nitrososphaerales archaeon]